MLTILRARNGGSVAVLACAGALLLTGCSGDDGIGKRFPVSGKVTYDGKPLTSGTVNFLPEDPATGRPATGEIQTDGSYKLTTQTPGDGAMGGKYKVSISAYETDMSKTQSPKQGGSADQVVVAQAQGKSLIPIKYTGTDTSGLSATVGPSSTSFNFDLKPE